MTTAEEWIREHHRFDRTINAVQLRVGLKRQKGHCTWCNAKVPSGRLKWCSESCTREGRIRFGIWHGYVKQRDQGICAICGFDSLACQRRVKQLYSKAKGGYRNGAYKNSRPFSFSRLRRFARRTGIAPTGQPYEIDHIIPVCEGGGCCGLDNLRTLCFVCHRKETKRLAGRRAAARRDASRPLLID